MDMNVYGKFDGLLFFWECLVLGILILYCVVVDISFIVCGGWCEGEWFFEMLVEIVVFVN